MGFIFDADVPVPDKYAGLPVRGPRTPCGEFIRALAEQPVGASGIAPGKKTPGQISGMLSGYGGKGWYCSRKTPEGVRVWKIAEPTKKRNG